VRKVRQEIERLFRERDFQAALDLALEHRDYDAAQWVIKRRRI
jgi:hypothetical protein